MEEILSPRIKMHINGHRFVAAYRIDQPGLTEPTEYAIFKTGDGYVISIDSGGGAKTGTLTAESDAAAIADAEWAVGDFHSVNRDDWARREVMLHI